MPLLDLVVLAIVQGAAEALPVSPSAHVAAARLWLAPSATFSGVEAAFHLATALALGITARKRLFVALEEGVRAIARPVLFQASPGARDAAVLVIASAASLGTTSIVMPRIEALRDAPFAIGLGLLVTGLGLVSTRWARHGWPSGRRGALTALPDAPSIPLAALAGIAHGVAVFPGASRVGAALTVLLWLGMRAGRAVDLAFLISLPSLILAGVTGLTPDGSLRGVDAGALAFALGTAVLAALLASAALRSLTDRRGLPWLALWIVPLALALLAYARALPISGS